MPIDDVAEREYRAELNRKWAKMRAMAKVRAEPKAKAKRTPTLRARLDQS